jgi:hypothetical protein
MAFQPQRMLIVAESLFAMDRLQEAEEAGSAALAMARAAGEWGTIAAALGLVANVLARRGAGGGAALLEEARGIAGRLGLLPLLRTLDGGVRDAAAD